MRLHRDERGQTIILVALSLPLMLGFVGIATDVGALLKDKRTIQTAADAAAIAGALNYNYGSIVWKAAAKAAATGNGFKDGSNNVTVTIPDTPSWPASNYYHQPNYVEVTISKPESTIFLALFGYRSVTVQARAVATNEASGSGCLYTVGTSGTTFTDNGGGNSGINAPGCGLVVESNGTPAMLLHGGVTLTLGSIGVVGTYSKTGGSGTVTPTPVQNVAPESDPLNYLPQFSFSSSGGKNPSNSVSCASGYDCSKSPVSVPTTCLSNGTGKKGALLYNVAPGATLSPGCYSTLNFPSSGNVTLGSGLYIVDGDVNFNSGNVTGSGVTFYTNGAYNFGSGTYNLTAPNDRTQLFNGILFAESLNDTNGITFAGNASSVIKGVVYFPDGSVTLSGNPALTLYTDFVVHDILLNGNVTLNSYASLSGVSNPLTSIALVE